MAAAANAAAAARQRAAVLAIILVSYLMIVLDASIVITALPKIRDELGFSATGLTWVQSVYTLAFGGLLLLGARAGDILGRRRMFIAGLGVFTAASLAIGLARSAAWLIAARAVQGAGAAVLAPSTLALLTVHFAEGPQRTRAVGYYGAVAGVGAAIGLVLGGVLADALSWRIGFFINLPIGLALMLGARRHLAETARHAGRFDLAGALTSTAGMGALVYGIVHAAAAGWRDARTALAVGIGLALLVAFVLVERRARQPILPLRLFGDRARNGALAARLLFLGAMVGFWFFTTQLLQEVMGYSAFAAGVAFLPMTLANFATALAVPRLTARCGNARVLAAGLGLALAGMVLLSRVGAGSSYGAAVMLPMVLIGVGQGGALSPLTIAGVAGVAAGDAGAASGLVNVAHQLGGSVGLGILAVAYANAVPLAPTASLAPDPRAALACRIGAALTGGAVMLALAMALALLLLARRAPRLQQALS
ncbi:MFS transporter [Duganella sp. LX20W]|uniref:MFS transporter n=1 Tax=Rugamonas brunnea TaxID=2758569 RepID=A0A7W2EX80_9BURK|nr:MFS transporter [Rugamonas brunnea]MBA5640225.1 MFS transporter [Rugamonas brunnea]